MDDQQLPFGSVQGQVSKIRVLFQAISTGKNYFFGDGSFICDTFFFNRKGIIIKRLLYTFPCLFQVGFVGTYHDMGIYSAGMFYFAKTVRSINGGIGVRMYVGGQKVIQTVTVGGLEPKVLFFH